MKLDEPIKCPSCKGEDVYYDGDSKEAKCSDCNWHGRIEDIDDRSGVN